MSRTRKESSTAFFAHSFTFQSLPVGLGHPELAAIEHPDRLLHGSRHRRRSGSAHDRSIRSASSVDAHADSSRTRSRASAARSQSSIVGTIAIRT